MKAVWIKSHPKFAYFVDDVCELDSEKFDMLKKSKHVKEFIPEIKPKPTTDLPKDIPGRDALIANGVTLMADVKAIKDFTEIKGIGKSTNNQIHEYLAT